MIKKLFCLSILLGLAPYLFSCAHPSIDAKEKTMPAVSKSFKGDANQLYYAVRWALKDGGYIISKEDLENGVIRSGWRPSKADTFRMEPFGHVDYIADGAYYMLEINIVPNTNVGTTSVDVIPHVKSLATPLHSSKIAENHLLEKVTEYLRSSDVNVTNVGVED